METPAKEDWAPVDGRHIIELSSISELMVKMLVLLRNLPLLFAAGSGVVVDWMELLCDPSWLGPWSFQAITCLTTPNQFDISLPTPQSKIIQHADGRVG